LQAYQQILPQIHELGASLAAISPETPSNTLTTAEKNALEFAVLSDVGNGVARSYGLVFQVIDALKTPMLALGVDVAKHNDDPSWELPITATYVVDRGGVIRLAFVDSDYRKRLEPAEILAALRACR
jgi:peroxiredoxin